MTIPGEKRAHILQALAEMLEDPKGEKITTAALANRLNCSEAALYRHFASKAQMYEGLIEFIESTLFGLINQIATEETDGSRQVELILAMLLNFSQRNRGMTKVLIGEALVGENERLQVRINHLHDKLESAIKQALRVAATQNEIDHEKCGALANIMLCYIVGRWLQYSKSGFTREPTADWAQQWPMLNNLCQSRRNR